MYLSHAQAALGDAFDYAVNTCEIPGKKFTQMFLVSSASARLENGEPAYLAGKSGIELAIELVYETSGKELSEEPAEHFYRSREYWIGWAAAWYQWYSDRTYREIFTALPYDVLEIMYEPLHEADITKFADIAAERMKACYPETNLKRFRSIYGITQAELARRSGVSLRSIQMYEQRRKDINKASAETLYRLSKVLGCSMERLIEKG